MRQVTAIPKLRWRYIGVKDQEFSQEQSAIDHAAVEVLHDRQQKMLGCSVDRMDLTAPPILMAYGCEVNGVIESGFYVEAVGELCFFGTNPMVSASAKRVMLPLVANSLQQRGIRWLRCFVPKIAYSEKHRTLADRLTRPLGEAGFVRQDEALSHFSMDLRKK